MQSAQHPQALFICGPSATGKSTLTRHLLPRLIELTGEPWCILDKDHGGAHLGRAVLAALGAPDNDRDSPVYKTHVRDAEYLGVLAMAAENLAAGVNCLLPAPFTTELRDKRLFDTKALGFPAHATTHVIWLEIPDQLRRQRIIERAHPQDAYKLAQWEAHVNPTSSHAEDPRVMRFGIEDRTPERGLTPAAWSRLQGHLGLCFMGRP